MRTETVGCGDAPESSIENVFAALGVGQPKCLSIFFYGEMSNGCVMLHENNLSVSVTSCAFSVCVSLSYQAMCIGLYSI